MQQKRLSIAAISGFLVELLNKAVPLLVIYFAQRRLGVEKFGFAMYGISMVELLLPFIVFGYNHFGSLQIAQLRHHPQRIGELISDVISLRLLHSLILCSGLYLFTLFVASYQSYHQLMLCLSFAFVFSSFELIWVHLAIQKMVKVNLFVGLGRFVSLALVLLWVKEPRDATLFAVLTLASNAFINLCTLVSTARQFTFCWPSWQRMQGIFRQSSFFAIVLALTTILERYDMVLVEQSAGSLGAGLYAGPARLGHSLFQVANAVVMAFFSEMIVLRDKQLLHKHLSWGLWALSVFLTPVLCGVWFVGDELLVLIFGQDFRQLGGLLGVMVINTSLMLGIVALGYQVLVVAGQVKFFAVSLFLAAVAACLLSWGADALWGLQGIALGGMGGRLVALALILRKVKRLLGALPLSNCLRGALPGLGMGLSLFFLQPQGLLATFSWGALFFGCWFLLLNRQLLTEAMKFLKKG